jgi:hypothetical protein
LQHGVDASNAVSVLASGSGIIPASCAVSRRVSSGSGDRPIMWGCSRQRKIRAAADAWSLYGQSKKDFGSFFIRAGCGFSVSTAASCCCVTFSWARGRGVGSGVVISVAATSKEEEHLAAAAIGVMWVMSASSS